MKGRAMDQHTIAINLAVVEAHCGSEAAGRVEEVVALYTDDIVWEAPSRPLRLQGQEAVAASDRQMFRAIKNVRWHGLDRFATEDRVVDDRVVSCEVATEGFIPLPIGTRGEMRLTHLSHMRDGKMAQAIGIEGPPHAVEGTRGSSAADHQRKGITMRTRQKWVGIIVMLVALLFASAGVGHAWGGGHGFGGHGFGGHGFHHGFHNFRGVHRFGGPRIGIGISPFWGPYWGAYPYPYAYPPVVVTPPPVYAPPLPY